MRAPSPKSMAAGLRRGSAACRVRRLSRMARWLPLRGVEHRIEHRRGQRGTVWLETGEADAPLLCVAGEEPHHRPPRPRLPQARGQARPGSGEPRRGRRGLASPSSGSRSATSRAAGAHARPPACLSYSWRLILTPPFVLDYLAAHEVAHLVEMNHSRRFWRLVERICPHMARAKTWLEAHGSDLHRLARPRWTASATVML